MLTNADVYYRTLTYADVCRGLSTSSASAPVAAATEFARVAAATEFARAGYEARNGPWQTACDAFGGARVRMLA